MIPVGALVTVNAFKTVFRKFFGARDTVSFCTSRTSPRFVWIFLVKFDNIVREVRTWPVIIVPTFVIF